MPVENVASTIARTATIKLCKMRNSIVRGIKEEINALKSSF